MSAIALLWKKLLTLWSCFIGQCNPAGLKDSQSLTLCLNSTKIVETLEDVTAKARAMYDAGAYLHWFWKHGCSKVTDSSHMFCLKENWMTRCFGKQATSYLKSEKQSIKLRTMLSGCNCCLQEKLIFFSLISLGSSHNNDVQNDRKIFTDDFYPSGYSQTGTMG